MTALIDDLPAVPGAVPVPAAPDAAPATTTAAAEERISDILLRAVGAHDGGEISVGEMNAVLGDRAFGMVVFALALPNCVVAPPGFGGVTGVLMALFAGQLAAGYGRPRLPRWVERKRFDRRGFARIVHATLPSVRRFERIARPRLAGLVHGRAERWLGLYMVVQAVIVALPIPFANWLPGMSLALMAAGLIERDGAAVLLGIAFGFLGIAAALVVVGGFVLGGLALAGVALPGLAGG